MSKVTITNYTTDSPKVLATLELVDGEIVKTGIDISDVNVSQYGVLYTEQDGDEYLKRLPMEFSNPYFLAEYTNGQVIEHLAGKHNQATHGRGGSAQATNTNQMTITNEPTYDSGYGNFPPDFGNSGLSPSALDLANVKDEDMLHLNEITKKFPEDSLYTIQNIDFDMPMPSPNVLGYATKDRVTIGTQQGDATDRQVTIAHELVHASEHALSRQMVSSMRNVYEDHAVIAKTVVRNDRPPGETNSPTLDAYIKRAVDNPDDPRPVTAYALESRREYLAETIAQYITNKERVRRVDPWAADVLDKHWKPGG